MVKVAVPPAEIVWLPDEELMVKVPGATIVSVSAVEVLAVKLTSPL